MVEKPTGWSTVLLEGFRIFSTCFVCVCGGGGGGGKV